MKQDNQGICPRQFSRGHILKCRIKNTGMFLNFTMLLRVFDTDGICFSQKRGMMKQKLRLRYVATAVYSIVALFFLIFFIYMGMNENVSVYRERGSHAYALVEDYSMQKVEDETAPAGIRKIYEWTLQPVDHTENCLCFYVVHQYVDVYYDGELMYSLTADESNRIGKTVSSNWVTVPIYREDNGKKVEVILTPLFENMIDFEPEFEVGSHFSIVFGQLKQDFLQLFLAVLCILLGFFIMAVQLYFFFRTNSKPWDMFFLGSFSLTIGIWRIADIKSSAMIFAGNPMVLGYITIGAVFLCSMPLLLFVSTLFSEKKAVPLLFACEAGSAAAFATLVLQVFGIAEFKEMLPFSHAMLILTVCLILALTFIHMKNEETTHVKKSRKYFVFLGLGILLDLISFYIKEDSSEIIFTMIAFVVYALIMFITNLLATMRKAYIDSRTGLSNKDYWEEQMQAELSPKDQIGIMMLDLNGLKKVNDTFGHEAGNRMIYDFSNILRNTLPPSSLICRWGGDEFSVMCTGANSKKLDQYVKYIQKSVERYNESSEKPSIFFAVGYAMSEDYPGLDRQELLAVADSQMYLDKKKWYAEQNHI